MTQKTFSSMNNGKLMLLERSKWLSKGTELKVTQFGLSPDGSTTHTIVLFCRPPETDYPEPLAMVAQLSHVTKPVLWGFILFLISVPKNYAYFCHGFALGRQNGWKKEMLWRWLLNGNWVGAKVWWYFTILDALMHFECWYRDVTYLIYLKQV